MGMAAPCELLKELAAANWQFYIDLAEGAFYLGYTDQAAWVMQKAVMEAESLGEADPRLPNSLNRLGVLFYYLGKYRGAEPLFQRAVSVMEAASATGIADFGNVLYNLGGLYKAQGRYPDAETVFARCLRVWEKALGLEHPDLALAYQNLGEMCMHQGRGPEALFALRRALALLDARTVQDWITLVVLTKLAAYYTVQDRYTEAEPYLWRAFELRRHLQGENPPKVAKSLEQLGRIYTKQRKFARAEPLYRLSLFILEKSIGRRHPDFLHTLDALAELYVADGKYSDAEPLFKLSVAAFEQALGAEHPHVADRLEDYATLLRTIRRDDEAEVFETRVRAIRAKRAIAI
jgi:tetratricopeptide (TPR) repeat protein